MKKRLLSLFLALVMIVSVVPFAVFADGCAHSKTHHESVEATCKDGYDNVVCDACGEVLSTVVLKADEPHVIFPHINNGKCLVCNGICGHEDYEIQNEEPATCRLTGYIWKKCNLCGAEFNHETPIDANAHTYVGGKCTGCFAECVHAQTRTESKAPSCAEAGYEKVICKDCESVISEKILEKNNEHLFLSQYEDGKKCRICNADKQDVCDHVYKILREEAGTCSLEGYVWEECTLCGKETNHATPIVADAHTYLNGKCTACFAACPCDVDYLDIKYASCKEEGYRKTRCIKCEKVLSETILEKTNEHLFLPQYENGTKCRLCDANLQDVCEHDYEIVREQAGTCIEAGYIWKECKLCGRETNNETELDPDGHDYMVMNQTEATCEAPAHVWKRCVLCANEIDLDEGEAAGHKFANGKCTVCGAPDPECPHANHVEDEAQYRAATCTVDGVRVYHCPDCGTEQRESIPMLGHIRVESTVEPTCTVNGTLYVNCTRCRMLLNTEVLPAKHNYVNGQCACGAIDPDSVCKHPQSERSEHTHAATCSEPGYKQVVCDACNTIIRTEILRAEGHNYVNNICTKCGTINIQESTSGHKFTNDYQDVFIVG